MKKVVKDTNNVNVKNVDPEKYYGIKTGNDYGFIARSKFEYGNYTAFCTEGFTRGNQWEHVVGPSLTKMCKTLIDMGFEVYEFDTPKELLKWLTDGEIAAEQAEWATLV